MEVDIMKYVYPAIFTPEEGGGFSVVFTDLESCYTCGDTLEEAMEMAQDVLALTLYEYESDGTPIPAATRLSDLRCEGDAFPSLIACDTMEYRKRFSNKAVKKTLSIPEWINDEATRLGVNFSQVLQEALSQKLGSR